jgi:hypothetical protein
MRKRIIYKHVSILRLTRALLGLKLFSNLGFIQDDSGEMVKIWELMVCHYEKTSKYEHVSNTE